MSVFCHVKQGPAIEVFAITKVYNEDDFQNKVNLGIGAYRTEQGKPWVLPVVKKAEKILAEDETLNKEYLPILGMESFTTAAMKMLLGADSVALRENRAFGVQSLSGTGALRVAAEFLAKVLGYKTFYISTPTWENHTLVFKNAGFESVRTYRYWSEMKRGLDLDGMLQDLSNAPEKSVVILHSCAHNPTGCDPTREDWKKIADVVESKGLFPVMDSAYQGFASGDLEQDAYAVRYFVSKGFELMCCQSFAKNFGLYNERVGNLTCVAKDASLIPNIKSQFTLIVRGMYSNPPNHGARIVAFVLNNTELFEEWKSAISTMAKRVLTMRHCLRDSLERLGTPGTWDHITSQIGMFSYTGLTEQQTVHLIQNYHVYLLRSGRINMCGLNSGNIDYVAKAIYDTVSVYPQQKL